MTAPAKAPRGRKPRFNDRRMEVLREAARIFAAKGYSQATLEDIAGTLNMTRAALYYYAEGKDQLLRACMDVAREDLGAALSEAEEQVTGLDRIRVYFRAHVAFGCDDFGRCFLLMDERDISAALREEQNEWRRTRNRRVEAMLSLGVSDGSLASLDLVTTRRLLFAVMNAVPLWITAKSAKAITKAADDALDVFIAGLAPRG